MVLEGNNPMTKNEAKTILWPANTNILIRFIWLYVGQGASTIVLIKNGSTYKSLLVDINLDSENRGVNVPALMGDLLDGNSLDVFVNTHPHDDHLRGLVELSDKMGINEIWHSDHKPGKKYDDAYNDLKKVIEKIKKEGGREEILIGSKDEKTIGEGKYYVLSPAEYVKDDVNEENPDTRYRRIHEQCAVLKFGINQTWGMISGDADRDAFEKHITGYHKGRLSSIALTASHHGSRTFFRYDEKDKPYLDALNAIDPKYITILAPKPEESKHDHPHEDAVELYAAKVGKDNVHHTGQKRYCYIFDIYQDGKYSNIQNDNGALAKAYPINNGDDGGKNGQSYTERKDKTIIPAVLPRFA
jgi:beta-lactamase superfamily II metal-dependent hydrolase